MFDRYLTIDWSASNHPKTGKDSIWICSLGFDDEPRTWNPPTRGAAQATVRDLLVDAVGRRERVLIGFDFPYAYPSGFAAALALGGPPWRLVWAYLEEQMRDDPQTNQSNRFEVASAINARLMAHTFWGCPSKLLLDDLSPKQDQARYLERDSVGLNEWRAVERVLQSQRKNPQSTWKLFGAGSVGSQALTGIPVVSRLRHIRELAAISKVWPFEVTIPNLPEGLPAIIHAEIWPSLIEVLPVAGQDKDQTQVVRLAEEFRDRDRVDSLRELFAAGGSPQAAEEGWILGVVRADPTRPS